jgi:hypothetical protein
MKAPWSLWKLKRAEDREIARLRAEVRNAIAATDIAIARARAAKDIYEVDRLRSGRGKDTRFQQQAIKHIEDAKLMRKAERLNIPVRKDDIVPEYEVLFEILTAEARERLKREIRDNPHPSVMDSCVADGALLLRCSDEGCTKCQASLGCCNEGRGSAFPEQRMERTMPYQYGRGGV